jgi:hypothetical protein
MVRAVVAKGSTIRANRPPSAVGDCLTFWGIEAFGDAREVEGNAA